MLIQKVKQIDTCICDEYIEYIKDRPFNDKRYYISNEKIKKLGWVIEEGFDKGLDELIGAS